MKVLCLFENRIHVFGLMKREHNLMGGGDRVIRQKGLEGSYENGRDGILNYRLRYELLVAGIL